MCRLPTMTTRKWETANHCHHGIQDFTTDYYNETRRMKNKHDHYWRPIPPMNPKINQLSIKKCQDEPTFHQEMPRRNKFAIKPTEKTNQPCHQTDW